MKKFVLAAASVAAIALAGCTSAEINQVAQGVNAACVIAGVGTQVGVIVTSNIGGRATRTGGTVTSAVDQSCAAITAATGTIVQQVTAAGGTADVQVVAKSPRLGTMRRKMRVRP